MADTKKQPIITIRAKKPIALPASIMGFSDLLKPKAFIADAPLTGKDSPKFNLDTHLLPNTSEALCGTLQRLCVDPMLEELHAEVKEKGGGTAKPAMSMEEWLEGKLKQPSERGKVQLPYIRVQQNGYRKGRDGEDPVMNTIACWPAHGSALLDLAKLRLGMGSTIVAIVYANLWASKAAFWVPQPSLKLVGIRVLKAVQFGGGRGAAPPEADDDAIKAAMGGDFQDTDFSEYALADTGVVAPNDDPDDHPEEAVKKLF
jgi:hypothetical protein